LPISERELRRINASRDSSVIYDDTECRKCSYNLKGLKRGTKCPECGEPITRISDRSIAGAFLVTASRWYLYQIAIAACVMFAAAAVGPFSISILSSIAGESPASAYALVVAVLWWLGVWFCTARRHPGEGERVPPREDLAVVILARATQIAWPLAAGVWIMALQFRGAIPNPPALLALLVGVGYLCGVFVGLRLARIAEAAADDDLGRVLRHAWVLLLVAPLAAGLVAILATILRIFVTIPVDLVIALCIATVFSTAAYLLWRVASLLVWAVRISREREARDARMIQRSLKGPDPGGPRLCPHCGENVSAVLRTMRCPRCGKMTA